MSMGLTTADSHRAMTRGACSTTSLMYALTGPSLCTKNEMASSIVLCRRNVKVSASSEPVSNNRASNERYAGQGEDSSSPASSGTNQSYNQRGPAPSKDSSQKFYPKSSSATTRTQRNVNARRYGQSQGSRYSSRQGPRSRSRNNQYDDYGILGDIGYGQSKKQGNRSVQTDSFFRTSDLIESLPTLKSLSYDEMDDSLRWISDSQPNKITRTGPMYGSPQPLSLNRLFIGHLPSNIDDSNLQQLFSRYGTVLEARVLLDAESGKSRGLGVVAMSSSDEMKQAAEGLDGLQVEGYSLKVNGI